jgi:hypothetical protein
LKNYGKILIDDGPREFFRSPTIRVMAKIKAVSGGWALGSDGEAKKQHSVWNLLGYFEDRDGS